MKHSAPFLALLCVSVGCSGSSSSGVPSAGIGGSRASGGSTATGGTFAAISSSTTGSDRPLAGGAPGNTAGGYSSTGGSAISGGAAGGSSTSGGSMTTGGTVTGTGGSVTTSRPVTNTGGTVTGTGGSMTTTGGDSSSGGLRPSGGNTSSTSSIGTGGTSSKASGGAPSGGSSASQGGRTATGGTSGAACDPSLSERNRTLVSRAIDELFVSKDITAADRYWSDPYLQHNPIAKSGVSTFRALMASLISSASFSYQRYLTLAECDLAVVYGRYSQSGVIFDMFRVQNDKIVEHWDSDSNQASPTSAVGALDATAASAAHRQLFLDLAAAVLVGADRSRVSEFLSVDYIDHRNTGTPGPTALTTMLTAEDIAYTRVHHVIADGNFVFALSEGKRGSTNYGFYDLFRAESSKFVERWDSRRTVPNSTASGLAIF